MRRQIFQEAIELMWYHICRGRVVSPVSELFAVKSNKVERFMIFQMLID